MARYSYIFIKKDKNKKINKLIKKDKYQILYQNNNKNLNK